MKQAECARIIGAMKTGGYYSNVMDRGPEYDRVKSFLRIMAGDQAPGNQNPDQKPDYACFPDLNQQPYHDSLEFPDAAVLESNHETIAGEASDLASGHYLAFTAVSGVVNHSLNLLSKFVPRISKIDWSLYPFYYMGVDVESGVGRCPETARIIKSLSGTCLEYPWGDAIFSVQQPRSGLPPHCSVDNFRVRCHLGVDIPPNNGIRVAGQSRGWESGRCLLFEDSFVHEVWNRSDRPRVVLIVDFWHPELTAEERQALTAGFRHSRVRKLFMSRRIGMTNAPAYYLKTVNATLETDDLDPLIKAFWE